MQNLQIRKTNKLFIGGQFVRSESGRSFMLHPCLDFMSATTSGASQSEAKARSHQEGVRISAASVKDVRQAVEAASKAQPAWASKSAYLRGQILYRMGEMLEGKRGELEGALVHAMALSPERAKHLTQELIDISVYYAGFADKYQQLVSNLNPVQGSFHNFTAAEPVGVVAVLGGQVGGGKSLATAAACSCLLWDTVCAALCAGNSVVGVMGFREAAQLPVWSEVCATSDVPAGVVNLLSGDVSKLYECVGRHMQVQSVQCVAAMSNLKGQAKDKIEGKSKKEPDALSPHQGARDGGHEKVYDHLHHLAASDMKRVYCHTGRTKSLQNILNFVEYKTLWHPVGF